ncbi:MAG: cysteine hydrolase family protein [Nitrospinota bacterium]
MAREVVIVVDMLKGFLEEGHPLFCGQEARKVIPPVVELLKGRPAEEIIYICDNHAPDDKEFKMWPPHCVRGTEQAELVEELKGIPGRLIPKTRYSGFFGTELERVLEELRPEKVIVVGVCTDICVMHTVADLRNRDYKVEVPRNCVASFDEEAHGFALKHLEKVLGAALV